MAGVLGSREISDSCFRSKYVGHVKSVYEFCSNHQEPARAVHP